MLGDDLQQGDALDRLGGVVVAAGRKAPIAVAAHGVGRQGDDRAVVVLRTQTSRQRVAIHDRHLHVGENDVEGPSLGASRPGGFEGREPVVDESHLGAGPLEHERNQPLVVGTIFGQQDAAIQGDLAADVRVRRGRRQRVAVIKVVEHRNPFPAARWES